MKRTIIAVLFGLISIITYSQKYSFSGRVLIKGTDTPVDFATVLLKEKELWSVANDKGEFVINNITKGKVHVEVSCLGYASSTIELNITGDIKGMTFYLSEDNLTLENAVVTAKENSNSATTNRTIDRVALDHMQVTNVTDISSLLPGGASAKKVSLDTPSQFAIRASGRAELGNATFGTAVEVDGIRLSSNAAFGAPSGVDTRNIASSNVESVEVITGVPSVEYGDMQNGVVKINTRKGKTSYLITTTLGPNVKNFSFSKGFELNKNAGIINASAEYSKSIGNRMSPYTTYDRKTISLIYSKSFNLSGQPIKFSFGVTGNIGGYNSKNDPDALKNTYLSKSDNTIRGNLNVNWLLNKSWITNIELTGSMVYSDMFTTSYNYLSSSGSTSSIHSMEKGYFVSTPYNVNPNAEIILKPGGYWYELGFDDSKPLNANLHLKANWAHSFGKVTNKIKAGAEYSNSGNLGKGTYYDDMSLAPTWRPYEYNKIPFLNNLSAYLEESATIPISKTLLNVTAGVRAEWTSMKDSYYGTVKSLSPRFNLKYTLLQNDNTRFLREFLIRGSWGISVKLPSLSVLYPSPRYRDYPVFSAATTADGSSYTAFYTFPLILNYNSNLKWQRAESSEVGVEFDLGGVNMSLVGFYNRTLGSFTTQTEFVPFSYNYTSQNHLDACTIPSGNRIYSIDRNSGVVTVSDKTGATPKQTLGYTVRNIFAANSTTVNEPNPIVRKGVEWVIDFGRIKALSTSIRIDGNYYNYKGYSERIMQSYVSNITMPDGKTPYQYIGYYVGESGGASNGKISQTINTNVTFTTHIPKIRMILSLRVEGYLYNYSQNLSEYSGGQVTFPISSPGGYFPEGTEFYDQKTYTLTYPLYYSSFDDPNTKIPYLEKLRWAKDNDPYLFTALSALINRAPNNYYFKSSSFSPFLSANISVTKEIGDIASISFSANNFFINDGMIRSRQTETNISLVDFYLSPQFSYSLTLRLKF